MSYANFNDSGENKVIIHGIFEPCGISKEDILQGAEVKILIFHDGKISHFITYFCTKIDKYDLDFYLECQPETIKYNKSIIKLFSKTCRAKFGDEKCKIDKMKFAKKYEIDKIDGKIILCKNINTANSYFSKGRALFTGRDNKKYEYIIANHHRNSIEIIDNISEGLLDQKKVILIPTCNKTFRTCCKKFNNAVNFRGEPTILEDNILKN